MPRVLFTSTRQDGFVLPLLQVAAAMVARGDEVFFLTGDAFRERIEAAGVTFLRLPYDDEIPTGRVHTAARPGGVQALGEMLRTLFLATIEADHRAVLELSASLRIDLIVTEPLFLGSAIVGLLPRDERPGVLSIGLSPLPLASPDTAPYGLGLPPIDPPLNALRNRVLGAVAEQVHLGATRRAFAREARRLTGVRVTGSLFDLALAADVLAQTTVSQFEYPRRRLPAKVRFVGPLPAPRTFPLPAWWDDADPRPIVHVTQGTYANTDPTELIVPTIRAFARQDVLVVATTGGPAPQTIERAFGGPLPTNARVERFMPYDRLLPAASVMVTNGGYGSVHHALRRGLPLVVSGLTEDKREVNARVAWSGAGVDLRQQRPDAEAVGAAVRQVLEAHDQHRRAAARLGAAIAATDAVAALLALGDEVLQRNAPVPIMRRPAAGPHRTGSARASRG